MTSRAAFLNIIYPKSPVGVIQGKLLLDAENCDNISLC
jgi:hypothetical protein